MAKSQNGESAVLEAAVMAALKRHDLGSKKSNMRSIFRIIPSISALEGLLCLIFFPLIGVTLKFLVPNIEIYTVFWLSN